MAKKALYIFLGGIAAALMVFALAVFQVFIAGPKNPPLPTADVVIGGETFRVELARSIGEKALGLSGRDGLGEREGMLFIFSARGGSAPGGDTPVIQNFWMKDMKFPIDIIWMNGSRVIGFAENAEPEIGKKAWQFTIYSSPEPADKVLEVRAGTVRELGVKVGDNILAPQDF